MPRYFIEVVEPHNLNVALEEYYVANLQDCKQLVKHLVKGGKQVKLYNNNMELLGIY